MKRHTRGLLSLSLLAVTAAFAGAMLGGTGLGSAATQARPTNQTPPTIQGTPQVGSTLTAVTLCSLIAFELVTKLAPPVVF